MRTSALATWTARLGGSHWLVARPLIGWLFIHDLEERCDVRASNIEFARAAWTREPIHRERLAAGVLTIQRAIDRYNHIT